MSYSYFLIDFDQLQLPDAALGEMLAAAEQLGFAGVNITHPFKQSVIPHLTGLSPEARDTNAVNTIVFGAGSSRVGHNTDIWGFEESFREAMKDCAIGAVLQLGAGGAGAAVAYALLSLGTRDLMVFDVDPKRSEQMVSRLGGSFSGRLRAVATLADAARVADGVVNATPVGMEKYPGAPLPADLLNAWQWVADIIYFPEQTQLLKQARARGCRTLAGAGMAIYQAVRAFELFTGVKPDRAAMTEHFRMAA